MTPLSLPVSIAVIGTGLLGRGICACLLGAEIQVVAVDRNASQLASARIAIAAMIADLHSHGVCSQETFLRWESRYTESQNFEAIKDCDFVIECVSEDLKIKTAVIQQIEGNIRPTTIICSNTSSIPITQMQGFMTHPSRFLGMHWAGPAHNTRFIELIRGKSTSDACFQATNALSLRIGKDPCLCQKDVPAFIVNRLAYSMYREALNLLESGVADCETIDRAVRNSIGLWASFCGPFRWIDISGGPQLYASVMERVFPTLNNTASLPQPIADLVQAGAHGTNSGKGFYNYSPEDADLWNKRFEEHVWHMTRLGDEYLAHQHTAPIPK